MPAARGDGLAGSLTHHGGWSPFDENDATEWKASLGRRLKTPAFNGEFAITKHTTTLSANISYPKNLSLANGWLQLDEGFRMELKMTLAAPCPTRPTASR